MPAHQMSGQTSMHMPLLPQWLRLLWAVALLAVVGLHVWHSYTRAGRHRWWHLAHTGMALGMIGMYLLPVMNEPRLARIGLAVFATATIAVFGTTALLRRRAGTLDPLWLATGLDMLAMTYMFLPADARPTALTWVAIVYLTGELLAWATNLWARHPHYSGSAARPGPIAADAPGAASAASLQPPVGLDGHGSIGVRVTLAAMAASMAYMLLAMGPGMTGMSEAMPGM